MGCCLVAAVLIGAPRLALFWWWFTDAARIAATFNVWSMSIAGVAIAPWLWPVAGFILVPWTTLAYVFVAPAGISTLDWVILGVALLIDLGAHGGGGKAYRQRRSN